MKNTIKFNDEEYIRIHKKIIEYNKEGGFGWHV